MSSGQGWTDKEKLAYIIKLLDGTPIDWKKAPIPNGRTLIACQRMLQRTKDGVKEELAQLKDDTVTKATKTSDARLNGASEPKMPKKRAPKKRAASDTGAKKGTKRAQSANNEDDEGGFFSKKIKMETKEENADEEPLDFI